MSFSIIPQKSTQSATLSSDAKKYFDEKSQAAMFTYGIRGISGWVFDIPTGESLTSKTDVSKHYMESGAVINDHAINEPDEITLTGLIGELVYRAPQGITGALQNATSRLGAVNAYLGPFTQGATQKAALIASQAAYIAKQAQAIAKRASNIVDFFGGEEGDAHHAAKGIFRDNRLAKDFPASFCVDPVESPPRHADNTSGRTARRGFIRLL